MSHVVEVWLGVVMVVATECRVQVVRAKQSCQRKAYSRFRGCKSNRVKWLTTASGKHNEDPHEHVPWLKRTRLLRLVQQRELTLLEHMATAFHIIKPQAHLTNHTCSVCF
jgi:hypothetical protein